MIRRPPRSTLSSSSAASDVYKRQVSIICTKDVSVILVHQYKWFRCPLYYGWTYRTEFFASKDPINRNNKPFIFLKFRNFIGLIEINVFNPINRFKKSDPRITALH